MKQMKDIFSDYIGFETQKLYNVAQKLLLS